MTDLMSLTRGVIEAQDALNKLHGEKGYGLLIKKMKEKTHNTPRHKLLFLMIKICRQKFDW